MSVPESSLEDRVEVAPGWTLWPWCVLRGTGFPVSMVARLATPRVAQAAREAIEAERRHGEAKRDALAALRRATGSTRRILGDAGKAVWKGQIPPPTGTDADAAIDGLRDALARSNALRSTFDGIFDEGVAATSRTLRELAETPRLREAVTWQNRTAIETAFDSLRRADVASVKKRDRQHEDLVASYVHRYCTKNDTIGFFGPIGWARLDRKTDGIVARPGRTLLAKRGVWFEQWPIDALAQKLTSDPRMKPWLVPRIHAFVQLAGAIVRSPTSGRQELSPPEQALVRGCDGTRSAKEVAAELVAAHADLFRGPDEVYQALEALEKKQLVSWTLEFRTTWEPNLELRRRLARVGDDALRAEAMALLDALESGARDAAAAAGDVGPLGAALEELDRTFTRTTGAAPRSSAGSTYAGRTVVFEDTSRDFDLVLGRKLIDDLAQPLGLVLTTARWLTHEAGRAYAAAFRAAFDELCAKAGAKEIPLADFWVSIQRLFWGSKGRPVDLVAAEMRKRWAAILDEAPPQPSVSRASYTSAAIAARVHDAFAAPRPGWTMARQHAPDVLLGADSIAAIERGDYFWVLGEVHTARNTLDDCVFASFHPSPSDVAAYVHRDFPEPRVLLVPAKHSAHVGVVRMVQLAVGPRDVELETGFEGSLFPRERVLRLGDLVVFDDRGELTVRTSEGRIVVPLIDVVGQTLSDVVVNCVNFASEAEHAPRITIDRLVVRRESWRFAAASLAFADAKSEADGFLGATRWAMDHGLPRFVFVKSPIEVKPIYVDFESTVAVRILRKVVRRAQEHPGEPAVLTVSEMLPGLHQAWLTDAEGERYTSELRIIAVDDTR